MPSLYPERWLPAIPTDGKIYSSTEEGMCLSGLQFLRLYMQDIALSIF